MIQLECVELQCPDAWLDSGQGETCDDGFSVNGDGCSSSCQIEFGFTCTNPYGTNKASVCVETCGGRKQKLYLLNCVIDGYNVGNRPCDDGNTVSGDGCSSTCLVESTYVCIGGSSSTRDYCEICGDSKNKGILECDDGNTVSGDGCSSTCNLEKGYYCNGGTSTTKDTCYEICGDGLNVGLRQCDDGNLVAGDGCSITCTIETGWQCSGGSTTTKDTCTPICGDGKRYGSEVCDDQNTANGDGCTSTCTAVEANYKCTGGTTTTKDVCERCGDGKNNGQYACDDNNNANNDGCSSVCVVEAKWTCSGGSTTTKDVCVENCGDGFNMGNKQCDDANTNNGDGCSSTCSVESGWTCSGGTTTTKDTCQPTCGNTRQGTEGCDDGNLVNGDGCSSTCTVESLWQCVNNYPVADTCKDLCGDGKRVTPASGCDDGNTASGDGCSATCTVETGFTCSGGTITTPDICIEICGDGKDFGKRGCEDGNLVSNDGCSSTCVLETGWTFTRGTSTTSGTLNEICGDGLDFAKFACEDGNTANGDGCSSICTIEQGYVCSGGTTSSSDTCTTVCGDSYKTFNEGCDDGNTVNGDGCSSSCQVETGWQCANNNPSACGELCGDGFNFGMYGCDDGNSDDGDGCSRYCTVENGWNCYLGSSSTSDICTRVVIQSGQLDECLNFASYFSSTCVSPTAVPLAIMASQTQSCTGVNKCPSATLVGDVCQWQTKLCATCRVQNGITMIRVQTNSMPDHCFYANLQAPTENLIDFEVAFDLGLENLAVLNYNTQLLVDNNLCSATWVQESNLNQVFAFKKNSGTLTDIIGISINGVPILRPLSEQNYDAFYPKAYSTYSSPTSISPDGCLGNNDFSSYYHYYTFSPCIYSTEIKIATTAFTCASDARCNNQKLAYQIKYFNTAASKIMFPIGLAKDGHIIYGPFKNDGTLWQPCEVDICNGIVIGGVSYAYVSTMFYPYTVGCWGPGNIQKIGSSCSTQPKICVLQSQAFDLVYSQINVAIYAVVYLFIFGYSF
eukprot:403347132